TTTSASLTRSMKSALSFGCPGETTSSPRRRRGSRCSGFWTNSAPSGMTMRTVGLLISDGVGDVGTLSPSDQWGRLPRVSQGVSRLGPGEAPRVAHVGPDVRLDVREDLPMVVAIVVDPLGQEVRDGEPTHGGMAAGPTEIAVVEPIDEGGARLADARPL